MSKIFLIAFIVGSIVLETQVGCQHHQKPHGSDHNPGYNQGNPHRPCDNCENPCRNSKFYYMQDHSIHITLFFIFQATVHTFRTNVSQIKSNNLFNDYFSNLKTGRMSRNNSYLTKQFWSVLPAHTSQVLCGTKDRIL